MSRRHHHRGLFFWLEAVWVTSLLYSAGVGTLIRWLLVATLPVSLALAWWSLTLAFFSATAFALLVIVVWANLPPPPEALSGHPSRR